MNIKIKWFIHEYYFTIILIIFFVLVILAFILYVKGADWKILFTIAGSIISFAYFIQKQQLDEAKFSNELFIQFNQRYANLNEKLNNIRENKKGFKEIQSDEIDTLNDYFNLCGEEYLFYRKGYIYREVWRSWVAGMKMYYDKERISRLWAHELSSESYYGLDINKEVKQLEPKA
jgi:cell division protein FtsW (lipid II flippase)